MDEGNRQLMWSGMLLFLLGLVTGLLEQRFTNVRMGLSAHLEGVMNGILLLALGGAWNEVRLPHPVKVTAYCAALYGTYVNWLVTSIAAAFGTAATSPITSAGHSGQPWQESFVAMGLPSPRHDRLGPPQHLSADNLTRLLRSLFVAARWFAPLSFKGFRHSARLGRISPPGWSLLPGAPALTRTGLSPARTMRLSGRAMADYIVNIGRRMRITARNGVIRDEFVPTALTDDQRFFFKLPPTASLLMPLIPPYGDN